MVVIEKIDFSAPRQPHTPGGSWAGISGVRAWPPPGMSAVLLSSRRHDERDTSKSVSCGLRVYDRGA
jgi:hypothetical protein